MLAISRTVGGHFLREPMATQGTTKAKQKLFKFFSSQIKNFFLTPLVTTALLFKFKVS